MEPNRDIYVLYRHDNSTNPRGMQMVQAYTFEHRAKEDCTLIKALNSVPDFSYHVIPLPIK